MQPKNKGKVYWIGKIIEAIMTPEAWAYPVLVFLEIVYNESPNYALLFVGFAILHVNLRHERRLKNKEMDRQ